MAVMTYQVSLQYPTTVSHCIHLSMPTVVVNPFPTHVTRQSLSVFTHRVHCFLWTSRRPQVLGSLGSRVVWSTSTQLRRYKKEKGTEGMTTQAIVEPVQKINNHRADEAGDNTNVDLPAEETGKYFEHLHNVDQNASDLDRCGLIARIHELETRLKTQTEQIRALTQAPSSNLVPQRKSKKQPNAFDPSAHHTRHIALKLSYLGTPYNGFEHTNNVNSAPPLPTVEEVLWKALRKARLISPDISEGADKSYEVVWNLEERARRYGRGLGGGEDGAGGNIKGSQKGMERLELNWEACQWSKCGRTDKGVSAFGQVVGVRVRSSRPKNRRQIPQAKESAERLAAQTEPLRPAVGLGEATLGPSKETKGMEIEAENVDDTDKSIPAWDPLRDELPYISILNNLLPPSIRILAWCPQPPQIDWDARFFCKERRYKYFFTNPAFCPTPGPLGRKDKRGKEMGIREGWLDIEAMKIAAKKLEGLHDFRNFCKIDAGKQMSSCERRITFADVSEFDTGVGAFVEKTAFVSPRSSSSFSQSTDVTVSGDISHALTNHISTSSGPKLYAFAVHGTAFLWHQVRCMAAILFLIGQRLESPTLIDTLLDIRSTPGRPQYEMADDTALVLWDCVFPGDAVEFPASDSDGEGMNWIYAGDEVISTTSSARGDGKFGVGGVVENLYSQWRATKLQETLSAGLLGLVLGQGDGSALLRGGHRDAASMRSRSQKVFDGSETPRLVGDYVPLMRKPKAESLEVINAKYLNGKQARRDAKKVVIVGETPAKVGDARC